MTLCDVLIVFKLICCIFTALFLTAGFGIGYAFNYSNDGWTSTFALAGAISLFMGVGSLYLPYSPTWMIYNDYSNEDVLKSLQCIYPKATIKSVHALIRTVDEVNTEKMARER